MADNLTREQVPNPTGKGGFGDHPENRSSGTWDKNNSYGYWLNYFKSLSMEEFKAYKSAHPDMTMAAFGAYARVGKSIDNRPEFQEVANRTEGMPRQAIDANITGDVKIDIDGIIGLRKGSTTSTETTTGDADPVKSPV